MSALLAKVDYKKIKTYEDIKIKQSNDIFRTFPILLENGHFSRILEIGTYMGGLSYLINKIVPEVEYVGYEIDPTIIHSKASHLNIKPVAFQHDLAYIREYVSREGRCLILCDGGNKVLEFETISPWLKENDVIMTHDYLDDMKHDLSTYRSVQGFRNPETTKSVLYPTAILHNLTDECDIDFTHSLWSHWTKKKIGGSV